MPVVIEALDLHKTLGAQRVLRGFSLDVRRGETLVLLGKSGGGKSVFLRHLIGLIKPDAGRVLVEGRDIVPLSERELEPVRRKIGMLFQEGALFDSMTVFENVAFPLWERGERDMGKLRRLVAQALERVNLAGQEKKMPVDLSGGMRKRVALARVLICVPEVILYDEPTSGLDPIVSDSINRLIKRLQSQLAVTSVVVTHDMASCFAIADRVALLHEGQRRFLGTPAQLRETTDPIVRDFVDGRSREDEI